MPRPSELRFSNRHGFYSTIDGRKYYFGRDKTSAQIAFGNKLRQINRGEVFSDELVIAVVSEFLEYKKNTQAEPTYLWYEHPLRDFVGYVGAKCKVSALRESDVEVWISKNWSKTRNGSPMSPNSIKHPLRAVKSCFGWAATKGKLISSNPFKNIEIGEYSGTEIIPTTQQLAQILEHWKHDRDFVDLLQFEATTGSRVEEARRIRTEQVNLRDRVIELDEFQTKAYKRLRKKQKRIIFLNDAAVAIVKRNMAKNPDGLLFQNPQSKQSDNGWTPAAVRSRFIRAEKSLGFKIQQKGLRHLFATEYLKKSQSVAGGMALLGHTSPKMIMVNYNKILQDKHHILEEANRVKAVRPARTKASRSNDQTNVSSIEMKKPR